MGENATSVLKIAANLSSQPNVHPLNQFPLGAFWRFGNSLALLETYDDGTISLAIGAPTSNDIGSIFIVNMTDQATIVSSVDVLDYTTPNLVLNERNYNIDGFFGPGVGDFGTFGHSIQNMGDLNGNGVNDILVGYPNLNSIGGAYIIYMNSDNSVEYTAKFQIDRFESKSGTTQILGDEQSHIDTFRKYFNYSDPPNMPTSIFQEHYNSISGSISNSYFEFGTAVINFGDVYNDSYADIGLSGIGHNSGTILVINRLGPIVNVTFDSAVVETIHYRPTTTDFITVNGIELHNDLDITVDDNIIPTIIDTTLQPLGTFTITFDKDIDASSVSINDFAINGIVYAGTVSVSGAVVTLNTSGVFATNTVNTVSIVDEVLDLFGNAAKLKHSSSTVATDDIVASRINKNTITLNFTDASLISSDNVNVDAFTVTGATVVSWSITDTVITIITSGLTGTHETPIVVYNPSYSTNLTISTDIVDYYISIKVVDKVVPEYIDTIATDINTITIQFSETLSPVLLNANNFTLNPNYVLTAVRITNDSIVLTTEDFMIEIPTVAYSALITDSLGNAELQSSTAVLASDAFGPTPLTARTIDINKIYIVFHEQFTQTVFDKYSITIDDLEIKDVMIINQTALQVITEQFSSNYRPAIIRIDPVLTDNLGNINPYPGPTLNVTDGIAPTPYALYPGYYPPDLDYPALYDEYYRTIFFDKALDQGQSLSGTSITLYGTSGLPLPDDEQFMNLVLVSDLNPNLIRGDKGADFSITFDTNTISFMNITGSIIDANGNVAKLGTIVYQYDREIPILTSANIIDDSTITMTFDKTINYSTVSIQDFTVNATITISDVLTRGNTIYLTTDKLLPGESYLVSLVGSVADYFNNPTNTTSVAILYETVVAESLTITSNNANPTYAKSGDTLTVNLTIDEILASANATILGNNVQHTSTDKTITINTAVPVNVVDGFTTFAIYVETVNGSTRTFTQNDLTDNSNVLIDNVNPSFVSSSYDFTKLVHLTFSENISSASAYEHDSNRH